MGNRLKKLRIEYNMTQQELGDMVHASEKAISRYENMDVLAIKGDRLSELADVFRVSTDYLLERTERRQEPDSIAIELQKLYGSMSEKDREHWLAFGERLAAFHEIETNKKKECQEDE